MNRRGGFFIVLAIAVGLLLGYLRHVIISPRRGSDNTVAAAPGGGFNRNVTHLAYTHHAQCRMDCRHITPAEIQDILQHGAINYRKTELDGRPCPAYALEGYTQQEQQHLRIVFAQCDDETRVVTCIDLDHDFECHCPGDEHKFDH